MNFTSFVFLEWFLPIFLAAYYLMPARGKNTLLTLASYVFYGWWRPDYIILMLVSTLVDFVCARAMGPVGDGRPRRRWLVLSLVTNLGLLAYFKYANLLVDSVSQVMVAGGGEPIPWETVILPIGISFFTFQSMSYTIDVYRGVVRPVRSFMDLACYVSMFPQLVAGPIVRYREVEGQLVSRSLDFRSISSGAFLFMMGFAKKVLVADQVAGLADNAFAMEAPGLLSAWVGVVSYGLQIYFDFSGYSDMAIGLGLMLGFRFPMNFDSPYKSQSITEFWHRWHMSLSRWLKDYLYISLGGNRRGARRTYFNIMITMLLGGLWHGAAWTFLLWGAFHGLFLTLERALGKRPLYAGLPRPFRTALTFLLVLLSWAIFRAVDVAGVLSMYGGMLGFNGIGEAIQLPHYTWRAYLMVLTGLVIVFALPSSWNLVRRFHPLVMALAVVLFLVAMAQRLATDYSPFIYFQF